MAESPIGSSLSSKEVVFLWCSLMEWDWIAGSSEMKPLGNSDTKLACLVGAVGRIMFISFRCLASFLLARYLRIHHDQDSQDDHGDHFQDSLQGYPRHAV